MQDQHFLRSRSHTDSILGGLLDFPVLSVCLVLHAAYVVFLTKDIKPSSALPDTTVYEPTPQPARRTAAAKASNNFFIFYLSEI